MKLVLISGGKNAFKKGEEYEIEELDKSIVLLSEKKNPKLLFIGLAREELEKERFKVISENFSRLGCTCKLLSKTEIEDYDAVKEKIYWADIIYVGGGRTLRLMNLFRKFKIDALLDEVKDSNRVLCGRSAGAICWCRYGNSDSFRYSSNSKKLIRVRGLNFVNILFCPHYDTEEYRQESLVKMTKNSKGIVSIAGEDCTALMIKDNKYRVLTSKDGVKMYKCWFSKNNFFKVELKPFGELKDLTEIT